MTEMKYIESSMDDKNATVVDRVNTINFGMYSPENIVDMGEYKDLHGERKRLERVIERSSKPFLIYGAKGLGKTNLVHSICRDMGKALIEFNCGIGTTKSDLVGRLQVDNNGSYFERGLFPIAYEVANHYGHGVLYLDEIGALDYDIQKWLNRPLDKRNSCVAGGRTYSLNEGCKLTVIATTNPIEYAGVNNLTEDLRSRFIGQVWDYPSSEEVESIVDWNGCSESYVKDPLLTLAQDSYSLRTKGDIDYVLSPRDLIQFTEVYRELKEDMPEESDGEILNETIKETILIKYTDPNERELMKARCVETFGVTL